MRIKKWQVCKNVSELDTQSCKNGMGYCYAVRFKVMQGFYLTKIGATSQPKSRLPSIAKGKLYAISPAHYNYYENEELLQKQFWQYRIPKKPGGKSRVELFNIDMPYLLKNIPNLQYADELNECEAVRLPKGGIYYKKIRDSTPTKV